jgi:hypothetical protein
VKLDVFGGPTAGFSDNILKWGDGARTGGKDAVDFRGEFKRTNNLISGFENP